MVPHLHAVQPGLRRLLGLGRLRAARRRREGQRGGRSGGDGGELEGCEARAGRRYRSHRCHRRRRPHLRPDGRRGSGVLGLEPVRAAGHWHHVGRQYTATRGPWGRTVDHRPDRRVAPHLRPLHRRLRRLLGPQRPGPAGHRERVQRRGRTGGDGGEPAGVEPWDRPHRQGPGRRRQAHVRLAQRRRRRVLGLEHLRAGRYRRHHQRPRRRRGWGDGRQPAGSGLRFW
mmetsp:Transcript_75803/g.203021  ORF Transcript_75803/g.203021 Transcript_75803/m.203021 type:complete len:228 (-) Transcript_75803:588-1271(-)